MAEKNVRQVAEMLEVLLSGGDQEGLLRRALEAALAVLMDVEVSEQIGAEWGARAPDRLSQRNGYRSRTFSTGLGTSVLAVPKLRQGSYMPSFLQAHSRSDSALRVAIATCYQQGVSTRNVQAIANALGIPSMSSSTVSRMVAELDPQIEAFCERELPACPYVYVDARYEHVREDKRVQKLAVLLAIGVREDGHREVLGFHVALAENKVLWSEFLRGLKDRGLRGVKLVVSDAHEGLRQAIEAVFGEARWQRCKVHFLRNLGSKIPKRKRAALLTLAKTIFEQETLEEALQQKAWVAQYYRQAGEEDAAELLESTHEILAHMEFPKKHWSKLHSTNMVERLNRELKRRTRVVSIFPNRGSLGRLVGALLLEEHEEWIVSRRYIAEQSMKLLKSVEEQLEELAPGAGRLLAGARPEGAGQPLQGEPTEVAA